MNLKCKKCNKKLLSHPQILFVLNLGHTFWGLLFIFNLYVNYSHLYFLLIMHSVDVIVVSLIFLFPSPQFIYSEFWGWFSF